MPKALITRPEELPAPACKLGYPRSQLASVFSAQQLARLDAWMVGQTMGVCDGRSYNHDTREYEATGCGPHGPCVYAHDVRGFITGAPVLD